MRFKRLMLIAAIVTVSGTTLSACYDDGHPGRNSDWHHHHRRGGDGYGGDHGGDRGGDQGGGDHQGQ